MVYALNLFVSFTNQTLSRGRRALDDGNAGELFMKLTSQRKAFQRTPLERVQASSVTLEEVFKALWNHYGLHNHQRSICARVLGFYLLMEQTRGAALADWIEACPERPQSVMLHPVVLEALAIVPIDASGLFTPMLLISTIGALCNPLGTN